MTANFEKEYQKKEKIKKYKNKMRVSWQDYSFYFFLFPLAFFCWAKDNIYKKYYKCLRHWNTARADKVLNKIIPKVADRDEETNSFCYCMDWDNNRQLFLKNSRFIDRTWIKAYYYTLLYYLETTYCPENYIKIIDKDNNCIIFTKTIDKSTEK